MTRYLLILLLCASLVFGDQISQEVVGASGDDGSALRGSGTMSTTATTLTIGRNIGGLSYWIWARFQSIPIPAGSVVDTAIITLTCATSGSATTVNTSLFCWDTASAPAPSDTTQMFNCAKTTAVHYWASLPSITAGTAYRYGGSTGNSKDPVGEVISRSDWASNNNLVVFIKDSGSTNNRTRIFASEDNTSYAAATLDIYYTPPSGVPSVYHGVAGVGRLHSPAGNSVLHKK